MLYLISFLLFSWIIVGALIAFAICLLISYLFMKWFDSFVAKHKGIAEIIIIFAGFIALYFYFVISIYYFSLIKFITIK